MSQRANPQAGRGRTVLVVLLAAGAILIFAPHGQQAATHRQTARSHETVRRFPDAGAAAGETRVARAFLAGYLSYLYGRTPVSAITHATPALARRLAAARLLIPPGIRSLTPRVQSLAQAPGFPLTVYAVISDGEIASYQLTLPLARSHGRLLVAGVEGK